MGSRWEAPWKKPLAAALAGLFASIGADALLNLSLIARCGVAVVAAYGAYGLLYRITSHRG